MAVLVRRVDQRLDMRNSGHRKGLIDRDFVVFFFGPLLFLIIVSFTGSQIFHGHSDRSRKRLVILLSSGTAFYL